MIPAAVLQLVHYCRAAGLRHLVCSPGSRSAPVLLSFVRQGGFSVEMVMDERSAAFKALGKALALQEPVALLCTSGTAVLNYAPAVAEAFYQAVPLLVLTADRPPEWIDQHEGQAIRQTDVFGRHVVFSATLPVTDAGPMAPVHNRRILAEAWESLAAGPVHLNIPLREPLYPEGEIDFSLPAFPASRIEKISGPRRLEREVLSPLLEAWNNSSSRLLVAGSQPFSPELRNAVTALSEYGSVPVLGDILHNLHGIPGVLPLTDFLPSGYLNRPEFQPEILVTTGRGVVSKTLRQFLRQIRPRQHWHISGGGFPADPYGTLTHHIEAVPEWFLSRLAEGSYFTPMPGAAEARSFFLRWQETFSSLRASIETAAAEASWSDFRAVAGIMASLPEQGGLFLGNSMPVRYAVWLGSGLKGTLKIFGNRGTSGIDGCVSTAMGIAGHLSGPLVALVGDMSFHYDRNGLWAQAIPPGLKLVVLNNGGGNIFRLLPDSGKMPELKSHFELTQPLSARHAAEEAGMKYFRADSDNGFSGLVSEFLSSPQAALLECFTSPEENARVLGRIREKALHLHEKTG
jgi:2-succinyl-5-enolpyruvyl-6-hydroxy-3-cyclohexene-1-carboxylate synthase